LQQVGQALTAPAAGFQPLKPLTDGERKMFFRALAGAQLGDPANYLHGSLLLESHIVRRRSQPDVLAGTFSPPRQCSRTRRPWPQLNHVPDGRGRAQLAAERKVQLGRFRAHGQPALVVETDFRRLRQLGAPEYSRPVHLMSSESGSA
jgi:hypothetical protein